MDRNRNKNMMKKRRLALDGILKGICPNVYFQPPENLKMRYPAIRYKRTTIENQSADNLPYILGTGYELTIIDDDPDSTIVEQVSKLPKCRHVRHYTAENLNHDTFIIYA